MLVSLFGVLPPPLSANIKPPAATVPPTIGSTIFVTVAAYDFVIIALNKILKIFDKKNAYSKVLLEYTEVLGRSI